MNGCERYREMIEEYIDGLLGEREEREFLEHLERCPACSAELEAETVLVEQIAALRGEDPGVEFTDAVMERLFGGEAVRRGVVGGLLEQLGTIVSGHPRLAWSAMISVALISAFVVPALFRHGVVGVLRAGTDTLSLLIGPLTSAAGLVDRILEVAAPLAGALYLGVKAVLGSLLAVAGTQQFSFVFVASILIIMTASFLMYVQAVLARRRFSDVRPQ